MNEEVCSHYSGTTLRSTVMKRTELTKRTERIGRYMQTES